MATLPPLANFNIDEDVQSTAVRWKRWVERFEVYLVAAKVTDEQQKRALMLHLAGERVYEIYQTLENTGTDYETVKTKLTEKFAPKVNKEFERFKFRSARQASNESLDSFFTRLRQLSTNCQFASVDDEVKSQIIMGCSSSYLRRKGLETEVDLSELMNIGFASEQAGEQIRSIENLVGTASGLGSENVNKIADNQSAHGDMGSVDKKECYKCGFDFPHKNGPCPAIGKVCKSCGRKNHFQSVCKSKFKSKSSESENGPRIRYLREGDQEVDYTFNLQSASKKLPKTNIKINGRETSILVDSGSTVNILSYDACKRLFGEKVSKLIRPSKTNILPYGSTQSIKLMGEMDCMVETKSVYSLLKFHIVPTGESLIGYPSAKELSLIRVCNFVIGSDHDRPDWRTEFKPIFSGIGKMRDVEVKLHIDKEVPPVAQRHRRVPFLLREAVDKEIQFWLKEDIIEEVAGPTPWVSPIVVVEKLHQPGAVRLCVDMREGNKAIQRQRHVMPTIDEVIHKLNGCKPDWYCCDFYSKR
jgi:predicted Zn-ribbon and HTH transcriptional regulator